MQTIEASLAAIIASTMPLLVGIALWVFFGERLRPLGIIGLIAGVIGVSIIMGARLGNGVDTTGLALCVIGVIALTAATLLVRGATSGGNFLMIVGLQMLVGCVALSLATLAFETPRLNPTWPLFFAFTYTCLIPGLAATIIWFWLVNRIGATRAATFHFLNPFFGVAVAAVLLSETIGPRDILGVAIIAAGILAVQISRQKKA
jgi:probable blue pigment (indigoidine) exporter